MEPKAHFIWAKIRSEAFAELLFRLRGAFPEGSGTVEFADPLSLHVTLLYLPGALSPEDERRIVETVRGIDVTKFVPGVSWFGYFGSEKYPRVCYAEPKESGRLEELHREFVGSFWKCQLDAPESPSEFVPHVTLFRILDPVAFLKEKKEAERILRKECERLTESAIYERVSLFRSYPGFQPRPYVEVG